MPKIKPISPGFYTPMDIAPGESISESSTQDDAKGIEWGKDTNFFRRDYDQELLDFIHANYIHRNEVKALDDQEVNTQVISKLQEICERVVGTRGVGHHPDELCCDVCEFQDKQRTLLATEIERLKS